MSHNNPSESSQFAFRVVENPEVELLAYRLIRSLQQGYRTIIEDLARLDRKALGILLYSAYLGFDFSLDTYSNEEFFDKSGVPMRFPIPESYDRWPVAKRRQFVEGCMSQPTYDWNGALADYFESSSE